MKVFAENKKAFFDFEILEHFEAGIELLGSEVKAIMAGKISLAGAYITFHNNEAFLTNATIAPYQPKNTQADYNEKRPRKLLLKKNELKYLLGKRQQKGLTIIPLRVYNKGPKIKIEVALARGRKKPDKRQVIKKREVEREIRRVLKMNKGHDGL